MADVTEKFKLEQIQLNKLKPHVIRRYIGDINTQISNYRIVAHEKKGTIVSRECNKQANILEAKLKLALGIKDEN